MTIMLLNVVGLYNFTNKTRGGAFLFWKVVLTDVDFSRYLRSSNHHVYFVLIDVNLKDRWGNRQQY